MDNERNIAKYGNVVPVKVVLTNTCTGASVTNVSLYITLAKGSGSEAIEDTNVIAESVSAADSGSQMRTADGMYIFNLSTKNLSANSDWTVRVRLGSTTRPVLLASRAVPEEVELSAPRRDEERPASPAFFSSSSLRRAEARLCGCRPGAS